MAIGVTLRSPFGRLVVSMISVGGKDVRDQVDVLAAGVAGTASMPRLAVILPNSSKAAEFISSCIAFGWSGMSTLLCPFRVLN